MYEELHDILSSMDILKDKQTLCVLNPQEEKQLAAFQTQYRNLIRIRYPELITEDRSVVEEVEHEPTMFHFYLSNAEVISGVAKLPYEIIDEKIPPEKRKLILFSDPDPEVRYYWCDDTKNWMLK